MFSLSSSAAVVVVVERPKRDPKPLNSGTSSFSGVVGLSDGTRFENDNGWTAGDGLVWLVLKPVRLGLGDTLGFEKGVAFETGLSTRSLGLEKLGFGDRPGFAKGVEFREGLTARSWGLADGLVWLLPREAAMIEAVELTPPNLAEGLIAGEGLVASVGEVGASREADGISVAMVGGPSCFGASGSVLLAFWAEAPPLLFLGPFALPLRTSARGAPSAGGSLAAATAFLDDVSIPAGLSDLEALGDAPLPGGPRARMLARPGLKRAASLLVGAATGGYVSRLSSAGGDAVRSSLRGRDVVLPRG